MRTFLDTYALIEVAKGNSVFKPLLDGDAITLVANLAELHYYMLLRYNKKTASHFTRKFTPLSRSFTVELVEKAMNFRHLHAKKRFSYIDCLSYTYALENNRVFITGDRAFAGLKNVKIIR